ncbi:MAG: thioredoxin family protein [Firmicutes bacterium]|nr:thioredoxin family protein [Bacillota bacterium]
MDLKNKKHIIYGGIGIVLLILIVFLIINNVKNNIPDNEKFANEYTEVGKNNVFVYRNADEIIKILEGGTGIVYLGFPECPWCQAYVPMLNEVAKEEGIEKIYYFNIKNDRQENTKKYQKIVKLVKNHLMKDDEGNERIFVPDIYAVKDGKILSHNNETSVIESDITPTQYWTDSKKIEIKQTFKKMINDIYSNVCKTCK